MICPHCGKTLEDNPKFCPWCGRPTTAPAPTGAAGAPRERIAAAPAAPRMGPPLPPGTSTPSASEVPDPAQRSTHTRTGLVVGVIVAVALALVAALSPLPGLLDSTRWSGPSLTISPPLEPGAARREPTTPSGTTGSRS